MTTPDADNRKAPQPNNTPPKEQKFPTGLIVALSILCVAVIAGMAALNSYVQTMGYQYFSSLPSNKSWFGEYYDAFDDSYDWEDESGIFDRAHPHSKHRFSLPPNDLDEAWLQEDLLAEYTMLYGDYATSQDIQQLLAPYAGDSQLNYTIMYAWGEQIIIRTEVELADTQRDFIHAMESEESLAMHESIAQVIQQDAAEKIGTTPSVAFEYCSADDNELLHELLY